LDCFGRYKWVCTARRFAQTHKFDVGDVSVGPLTSCAHGKLGQEAHVTSVYLHAGLGLRLSTAPLRGVVP